MSQRDFTVERADVAKECIDAIIDKVPKSKRAELIGEMNDLFLFLEAARLAAAEHPVTV